MSTFPSSLDLIYVVKGFTFFIFRAFTDGISGSPLEPLCYINSKSFLSWAIQKSKEVQQYINRSRDKERSNDSLGLYINRMDQET